MLCYMWEYSSSSISSSSLKWKQIYIPTVNECIHISYSISSVHLKAVVKVCAIITSMMI